MLRVLVYDIADPKRLRRIATVCEDFGVRVQRSVFECWLDDDRFDALWSQLRHEMNLSQDSLVAYVIDERSARKRRNAGESAIRTEKRSMFLF